MCLWFCETFCCFLLRCRDSYTQNTSTTSNNPSRGADFDNPNQPRDLENAEHLSTMSPPSGTGEAVQYNQPRSRQVMLLGNSWQQQLGRDKPLPPMIPELKGTGFNLESDPHGLGLVIQGRGNSDSYAGQDRGEDSLGDVGLYSVCLIPISRFYLNLCYAFMCRANSNDTQVILSDESRCHSTIPRNLRDSITHTHKGSTRNFPIPSAKKKYQVPLNGALFRYLPDSCPFKRFHIRRTNHQDLQILFIFRGKTLQWPHKFLRFNLPRVILSLPLL